ncbi:hypothetical protein A1O1_03918 [Capronia coronata CBS 617.96]|uniref:Yippee domain-containing protein n=1 Tax=Capronia coronata CBS 617.96 TaxID=1182541 RepID=W9YE53_9EURO|nr:uncharacterized protein A1O1_03918 [Capronia coronata CBS 617.96]EXJ90813.1 hypothetical protein A1O1_03918 [Capronia coronata CBS 617.96]
MSFLRKTSDAYALSAVFPTYLIPSVPFRRKSRQSSTDSNNSSDSNTSTSHVSVSLSTASSSSNPFVRCLTPTPIPASSASSTILPPDDKFLHGHRSHIQCAKCSTDLCLTSQIISRGFTGRHGRAYLVQGTTSHIRTTTTALPNTFLNKPIPRNLVTGQHIVSDISCAICGSNLGWKYVQASEESQKYKVGKFILETKKIRMNVSWENKADDDDDGRDHLGVGVGVQMYHEVLPLPPRDLKTLAHPPAGRTGRDASSSGAAATARGGGVDDLEFDSQDEDECEDLFAGVWSPELAADRRQRKKERLFAKRPAAGLMSLGASDSLETLS